MIIKKENMIINKIKKIIINKKITKKKIKEKKKKI